MSVSILQQMGHNFLWIDGYLWMWDTPFEVEIQKQIASEAEGHVIVAGYGLGIIQRFLEENPLVTEVTTIEKNKDVFYACKKVFGKTYGGIMFIDFFDVIVGEEEFEKPDCVIGDIWPEISSKYLDVYKRFKIKAEALLKPNGKILGWGMEYYEYLLGKGVVA